MEKKTLFNPLSLNKIKTKQKKELKLYHETLNISEIGNNLSVKIDLIIDVILSSYRPALVKKKKDKLVTLTYFFICIFCYLKNVLLSFYVIVH